jgi:hypothetical protein
MTLLADIQSMVKRCSSRALALSVFLISIGLGAQPDPSQSFLPLRPQAATYVQTYDASITMGFVVETSRGFSDSSLGKVRFENPWMTHSWIVFEDSYGSWLAGFSIAGTDYYFPKPSPLFMKGGYPGRVWTGEMTQVTQTGAGLSIQTPAGQVSNASRFLIRFSDGSTQEWTVAPGRGIVAGGPASADVQLTGEKAGGALIEWSPLAATTGKCSVGGVSAIPMDAGLDRNQRRGALDAAVRMGAKFNVSTISWSELEPAPRYISSQRIVDEVDLAAQNGMDVALILRTIDTSVAHRPSDIKTLAWDHPTVVSRFTSAAKTLLSRLPAQPRWLHLGYEVEPYLMANPQQVQPFKRFVSRVKAELKKTYGGSVGIVFGFDATKGNVSIFNELQSVCDHIAFDYYALRPQRGYMHVGEDGPIFDVPLMLSLAGNRTMLLTEVGYASSIEVNGSLDKQSRFYATLLDLVAGSKGQIAAVNVWSLNDMPREAVDQTILGYGLDVPGAAAFLSSLGIRYSSGTPKPTYSTVLAGFQELHLNPTCPSN